MEFIKTILKASRKTFFFIFLLIILPLTFLQVLLETINILALCTFIANRFTKSSPEYQYANSYLPYEEILGTYPIHYCFYLVLFFPIYLLSITAMTLTVASSFYISKPSSYVSILSAIPRILKRVAITFLLALPQIFKNYMFYCAVFSLTWKLLTLIRAPPKIDGVLVKVIGSVFANMVSVLEAIVYGSTTQLLQVKRINSLVFYFLVSNEVTARAKLVIHSDNYIICMVLISSLWLVVLTVFSFLRLAAKNLYYQVID